MSWPLVDEVPASPPALCEFLVTAVTNSHKLRGLNSTLYRFVLLQTESLKWVTVGKNRGIRRAGFLCGGSRIHCLAFATCVPGLRTPVQIQSQSNLSASLYHI